MPTNKNPHVSILILNWNGWLDTIECLESVFKLDYDNFSVLLLDNGSKNDSVSKIIDWAEGRIKKIKSNFKSLIYPEIIKPVKYNLIDFKYENFDFNSMKNSDSECGLLIVQSKSNLGFARGNNIAMQIAEKVFESDYYFLLNNDTVIHHDALIKLVKFLENNNISVAQSVIYKYENPDEIANAGGKILYWGQTKYYKKIKHDKKQRISFINGCALMIKSEIIQKYGYLSEKFFFGEEDFEFSMRMKRNKIKMICVEGSIVYHKIGTSINQYANLKKRLFIHGLNRLIDLKDFYSPLVWEIWKEGMLFYYFFTLVLRHHILITESFALIKCLRHYSLKYNNVNSETLDRIFTQSELWKTN